MFDVPLSRLPSMYYIYTIHHSVAHFSDAEAAPKGTCLATRKHHWRQIMIPLPTMIATELKALSAYLMLYTQQAGAA